MKRIAANSVKGRDVLGLSEMQLFGQGIERSESGSGCEAWDSMKNGVVWAGLHEGHGGKDN